MPVSDSTAGVVGGTGVSVGRMGVSVGETGVSVDGTGISVGGAGVSVGVGVESGVTVAVSADVGVLVGVKDDVTAGVGERDGAAVGRTGVGVLVSTEASMSRQSPFRGGGENFTTSTQRMRAEAIPPYMQYKAFCTRGVVTRVNNTPAPLRRTANKVTVASVVRYSNIQRNSREKRKTMITTETKDRVRIAANLWMDISASGTVASGGAWRTVKSSRRPRSY